MVNFNSELRIKSIELMIRSCEYHHGKVNEDLERTFGFSELERVPSEQLEKARKEIEEIIKEEGYRTGKLPIPLIQDNSGNYRPVRVTYKHSEGDAVLIYEFNSFCTDVITCVNYLVDMKLRVLDNYEGKLSVTIGKYLESRFSKKNIKNRGIAHKIIEENYKWIKAVNFIRNRVIHSYIQDKLFAFLQPLKKGDKVIAKVDIITPFHHPYTNPLPLRLFCGNALADLKKFKDSLLVHLV